MVLCVGCTPNPPAGDGGVGGDGGMNEGGGSFGCSAGGRSTPVWPAIVIGLAFVVRRRR